jgi:hypothetical protein
VRIVHLGLGLAQSIRRSNRNVGDGGTMFGVINSHYGSILFTISFAKSLNVRMRVARAGSCAMAS